MRCCNRLLWTHLNPANICKKLALLSQILANIDNTNRLETRMNAGFTTLFSANLITVAKTKYPLWKAVAEQVVPRNVVYVPLPLVKAL
jgi:hypothetical protein